MIIEDLSLDIKGRVVFTNGCFDILTKAHCAYLKEAKKLGDVLVVGLNSDSSVKKLKGPERPVNNQDDRAFVLESLESVDYVFIFDDETIVRLLSILKPDVWVKGGDYTIDTINQEERKKAEELGVEIKLMSKIEGESTTTVIEKMQKA